VQFYSEIKNHRIIAECIEELGTCYYPTTKTFPWQSLAVRLETPTLKFDSIAAKEKEEGTKDNLRCS